MSDHPTPLTEAIAEALYVAAGHDLDRYPWSKAGANEGHKARYRDQAARMAPILAARTPTATGDDLRDRVTALADEWDADPDREMTAGWAADRLSKALCASFAASPAPVVSRPEAADVMVPLTAADASDLQRWLAKALDGGVSLHQEAASGGRRILAAVARAVSLATDPEAGGDRAAQGLTPCRRHPGRDRWEAITWPDKPPPTPAATTTPTVTTSAASNTSTGCTSTTATTPSSTSAATSADPTAQTSTPRPPTPRQVRSVADWRETWARVQADPEVVAAHEALEAHEREEDRLTLELGRAVLRARARVDSLATDPEAGGERCRRCDLETRYCPHGTAPEAGGDS